MFFHNFIPFLPFFSLFQVIHRPSVFLTTGEIAHLGKSSNFFLLLSWFFFHIFTVVLTVLYLFSVNLCAQSCKICLITNVTLRYRSNFMTFSLSFCRFYSLFQSIWMPNVVKFVWQPARWRYRRTLRRRARFFRSNYSSNDLWVRCSFSTWKIKDIFIWNILNWSLELIFLLIKMTSDRKLTSEFIVDIIRDKRSFLRHIKVQMTFFNGSTRPTQSHNR